MKARLVERDKNFMNTTITIKVVQSDESTVGINESFEKVFYEFERIVDKFTRFNENSELSNLNRNSGKTTTVSKELFSLVKTMLDLAKQTDGNFDPTIIDFLDVYGYNKDYDFSNLDNPKALNKYVSDIVKNRPSWKDIELDEKNYSIKLSENQRIDLGGIGKGYAIQCAKERLLEHCKNFMIDAGGDIYAGGKNLKGEKWQVALKTHTDVVGSIPISNQSLSCSGNWARKVKQFHHLINPKTGKPKDSSYSTVFVLGDSPALTDGWATALFIGGEGLIDRLPKGYKVFFH